MLSNKTLAKSSQLIYLETAKSGLPTSFKNKVSPVKIQIYLLFLFNTK
jgi:hypothetical protein